MALLLTMPSLSPTMESGIVNVWHKKEGETVEVGDILAEIETDKAVMDYEVADGGILRALLVEVGQEVAVGAPIAILADSADEDITALLTQAKSAQGAQPAAAAEEPAATHAAEPAAAAGESAAPAASPPPEPQSQPVAAADAGAAGGSATAAGGATGATEAVPSLATPPTLPAAPPSPPAAPVAGDGAGHNGGRVRISPYGRKLAEQNAVDWHSLVGSGPGGRIIAQDVEGAIARGGTPAPAPPVQAPGAAPRATIPGAPYEDVPLSMMRRAIAKKMEESKRTVPHFQATRKIRAERLSAAREALNEEFPGESRISLNDMIVKGCAVALRHHPVVNSQYLGDHIRRLNTVDIAVAVGTEEGLITPIVRDADRKGLRELSAEIKALAARARERRLTPEEYTGGSFTVSNLGMYGVTEFNGIINTPQACILAVSATVREPVVEGDALVPGLTMNLTLSSDHRIVDGLAAAQFLDTLARLLENPVAMLL